MGTAQSLAGGSFILNKHDQPGQRNFDEKSFQKTKHKHYKCVEQLVKKTFQFKLPNFWEQKCKFNTEVLRPCVCAIFPMNFLKEIKFDF